MSDKEGKVKALHTNYYCACQATEEYALLVFTSPCVSEILHEKLRICERIKQKLINIELITILLKINYTLKLLEI